MVDIHFVSEVETCGVSAVRTRVSLTCLGVGAEIVPGMNKDRSLGLLARLEGRSQVGKVLSFIVSFMHLCWGKGRSGKAAMIDVNTPKLECIRLF